MDMIAQFERLSKQDIEVAGGKGANLGEMLRAGLPVPPGFVVTVAAYRRFLSENGLEEPIRERLRQLDVDSAGALEQTASALQAMIRAARVPADVVQAVREAYAALNAQAGQTPACVAVRSSATAEDTARYSFAGMFQSFLNVQGEEALLTAVRDCWASLFGPRLLFYRVKQGVVDDVFIGVVVQLMVASESAGVLFTADPASGDRNRLVIEAAFGLGEVVVGGQVTPDRYVVDRSNGEIIAEHIGSKAFKLVRSEGGGTVRIDLPDDQATVRVLSRDQVGRLAALGERTEAHYGKPQDMEWAIDAQGSVFIVQTRPITTLGAAARTPDSGGRTLLQGLGASPGVVSGPVRILASPAQGDRLAAGEVLVTTITTPDWVPVMRRAAAIITDTGGMTSHAAIVSRELGIPCIVGTREATRVLRDGMRITVNAREGIVLEGDIAAAPRVAVSAPSAPARAPRLVTATRLYVNLAEPDRAEEVAALDVDGVGLLRAEFMILDALENVHPRAFLERHGGDDFIERMASRLRRFAAAFQPRPVIYRAMDFRSNEFRGLEGGSRFEPDEANPMIGYRGCYRYVQEPDLFELELRAIERVRSEFDNLHLMIPFVRTAREFGACRRLLDRVDVAQSRPFELWVMAEVPSVIYWLPEYVKQGATGVSIGSNDLTQLMLGVDRDSERLASLFDERDGAVLDAIHRIIGECRRLGVTSSICGQAPSVYPDYADRLVAWGIDSISVNPDAIDVTRQHIAAAEQRLLLEEVREHADELVTAR
jgi:pyruvate,water dikinase